MEFIKTIDPGFHENIFGDSPKSKYLFEKDFTLLEMLLESKGLVINDKSEQIELPLPDFNGTPLKYWVEEAADEIYADIYAAIDGFTLAKEVEIPSHFECPNGWSKWDGQKWIRVNQPSSYLIFDFETHGDTIKNQQPLTCMGVDPDGNWFAWLAPLQLPLTVEFGADFRLGIGHYVAGFDKKFVAEGYQFGNQVLYVDTISLHTATRGQCDGQSKTFLSLEKKYGKRKDKVKRDVIKRIEEKIPDWYFETCGNSLQDYCKFYLNRDISKDIRENLIVGTSLESKRQNIEEILRYNAEDVKNTFDVFKVIWKEYIERLPSPVVFGGMLEKSRFQVHVSPNYQQKIEDVEKKFDKIKKTLEALTANLQEQHLKNKTFETDQHLKKVFEIWQEKDFKRRQENARKRKRKILKELKEELKETTNINETLETLEAIQRLEIAIEKPNPNPNIKKSPPKNWLKSHWSLDKKTNRERISLDGRIAHLLMGIRYQGVRIEHNGKSWGIVKDGKFERIPHPEKPGENVGKVLTEKFLPAVEVGELTADYCNLEAIIKEIASITQWTSNRERLSNVVIRDEITLPDVVPFGTVSLRTSSKLWMLLPNDRKDKAGSEAKSWFECKPGFIKVSADYDSQEQVIAAAIVDSHYGYPGLNLWACQIYAGDKADGSDQHSYIARKFGLPRNPTAKNCNYANQYFCGVLKLASMIYVGNKGKKSLEECMVIATGYLEETRGFNNYGVYEGGTASPLFNILSSRAKEPNQKSLIYGSMIPVTVDAATCGRDYGTTRINLSIQATGQELLHTLLVVVNKLTKDMGIQNQLSLTVHDEFHYYLRDNSPENLSKFLWVLQVAHLISKALLYQSLNVATMPASQCWLSSIEIDKYYRKGYDHDCLTPTNDEPLPRGLSVGVKKCLPHIQHQLLDWFVN